jgi:AcrR family transcriptional regulator
MCVEMARTLSPTARAAALDAVREIVQSQGVHACTVDEVARVSGLAKTTVYRHFPSVDLMVLAALDGMVKSAPDVDTGSLQGDLTAIMQRYVAIAKHPRMAELYAWMLTRSTLDAEFAAAARAVRVQSDGATVLALQRAIARGEVPASIDIPLAMHLVQGAFTVQRLFDGPTLTAAQFDRMIDWCVAALTAATSP